MFSTTKQEKKNHFQDIYTHQESCNQFFQGVEGAQLFLCLQLLILHDKCGKDGIREQAVVSTLPEESVTGALKDCCELLAASFVFSQLSKFLVLMCGKDDSAYQSICKLCYFLVQFAIQRYTLLFHTFSQVFIGTHFTKLIYVVETKLSTTYFIFYTKLHCRQLVVCLKCLQRSSCCGSED